MRDEYDGMTPPAMGIGPILPQEPPHGVIAMDEVIPFPDFLGDERWGMPSGVDKRLVSSVGDGVNVDQIRI
jgi:hypothetical protein